ncbi:MAG: gamma-glutamyl-gamma-aminobutyrate hydrolase family protein [Planctomycetaceae bacterium]
MSPPLIGITTYAQDEEEQFPLPRQYVDCVRRAGAVAVLIPPGEPRIDELLDTLDGLILAGGGDLDPARYDGRNHDSIYAVDEERDATEFELARRVIDSGMPTLAICRGIQVVNVVLGGTLIEHLPDEVGEDVVHRLPPREPTNHPIRVEPRSRLAEIVGELQFTAASWHHQAARRVADDLVVTAYAPDGTIEAAEMPDHPWMIAVQWHPELSAEHDVAQQRLFDSFVSAANGHRR